MKRLILAGGGHAHLHVLKALAARRWPGIEVLLVTPTLRQIYSGMVPGWMAGHYALDQCAALLEPLARAASVRLMQDTVTGVDAERRLVRTHASGEFVYDVLSLDTGAQVDGSCLAATGAMLLPIRPLEEFVPGWNRFVAQARQRGKAGLVVVGAGAAGVELALAGRYRLAREVGAENVQVSLVTGAGLMPGHGSRVVQRVRQALGEYRIVELVGYAAGSPQGVVLDSGATVRADAVIAATGVRPPEWLAGSGLKLANDGFVAVADGQQSVSHPEVFAGGDVASRVDAPHAKSGVYAVRAGPVLTANLERALAGQAPLPYRPQKRTLYLLATGPREAIMSWNGLSACGHWVWRWKNWIDRRFMSKYHSRETTMSEHGT